MKYVEKPTAGFNTPYQSLVHTLADHMLQNPPEVYNDKWFEYWNCLNENECEITKPVSHSDNRWETTIASEKRGIAPTKVQFSPLTETIYFADALTFRKRIYALGQITSEPGFYFLTNGKPLLAIRRMTDINNGLRYDGCELTKDMYSVSAYDDMILLDCPVVKGKLPVIYI